MKKMIQFAALLTVLASTQAYAYDRRIEVVNHSSEQIVGIWGSNVGTDSWQNQILNTVIDPGETRIVNFEDYSGYCRFDLKAVTSSGAVLYERSANICELNRWNIWD